MGTSQVVIALLFGKKLNAGKLTFGIVVTPALTNVSDIEAKGYINIGDFIQSLMRQVIEPGKFASWIAPPRVGIDNKPGDFEYVKLAA